MEYDRITVDAHSLIWYVHEPSNVKLTQKALEIIDNAERNGIIYVPSIVLLEILRLVEKGKYPISFDALVKNIENHARYEVIPLNTELISILKNIHGLELHDRVIVATAMMTNTILVSKDREIRAAGLNVIWSAI